MTKEEKDLLYLNNYKRKSFQWELWSVCNNLCEFCYLGKTNRHTDKERQLTSLNDLIKALNVLDFNKYNNISLIGGEFFQGQLDDPEVHDKFMEMIDMIADFYEQKKIGSTWIAITLTIGDQKHLYEVLDKFDKRGLVPDPDYGSSGLWLCTSYDTKGRFHTEEAKENWKFHMKNIHEKYPWVKFNTTCILTEPFIQDYLDGKWSPKKFSEEYHTSLFYKQSGIGLVPHDKFISLGTNQYDRWINTKQYINDTFGWNFMPRREVFLKFLKKYAIEDRDTFDRLYNINYRSDELHRNFNDVEHDEEFIRRKDQKAEEIGEFIPINECGHNMFYAAYVGNNHCTLCDKQAIAEALDIQ